jgi:hypothetical protein
LRGVCRRLGEPRPDQDDLGRRISIVKSCVSQPLRFSKRIRLNGAARINVTPIVHFCYGRLCMCCARTKFTVHCTYRNRECDMSESEVQTGGDSRQTSRSPRGPSTAPSLHRRCSATRTRTAVSGLAVRQRRGPTPPALPFRSNRVPGPLTAVLTRELTLQQSLRRGC